MRATNIKTRSVVGALKNFGFKRLPSNGGHALYMHDGTHATVSVPEDAAEISDLHLRGIYSQVAAFGIASKDDFNKAMRDRSSTCVKVRIYRKALPVAEFGHIKRTRKIGAFKPFGSTKKRNSVKKISEFDMPPSRTQRVGYGLRPKGS